MGSDVFNFRQRNLIAAWRSGHEEQLVFEYILFESENQHRLALKKMLESERKANITLTALRSAERELSALVDIHDEEIRNWGRHYGEREVEMDISIERAESVLLQAR